MGTRAALQFAKPWVTRPPESVAADCRRTFSAQFTGGCAPKTLSSGIAVGGNGEDSITHYVARQPQHDPIWGAPWGLWNEYALWARGHDAPQSITRIGDAADRLP